VREAHHSAPSGAEVKNEWSYTSTPPIRFHGMALSKKKRHRNDFTFYHNDFDFLGSYGCKYNSKDFILKLSRRDYPEC
jgi:hypothetical protein